MTSVTGTPLDGGRYLPMPRRAPMPGEVGHPGTCPLCTTTPGKSAPPCLACRDELRARLVEYNASNHALKALN